MLTAFAQTPEPTTAPRPGPAAKLDPNVLRAALKRHLERLAGQVDATRRDAGFQEALRTMARFWRYSLFNQFLIAIQCDRATAVTGRLGWEGLGRRVKDGERPLWVLAPSRRRGGDTRFHEVPVYDLRQTRGRKLATVSLALHGGTRHTATLKRAAAVLGVTVQTVPLPDHVRGRSLGGRIELQPGLTGRERAATLAHELAHELLHQEERRRAATMKRPGPARTREERETEADATAWVVLSALGLLSKAPAYIAWQGGTGAMVLRSMSRVHRAAARILRAAGHC